MASNFQDLVFIALGSNLGNSVSIIQRAMDRLKAISGGPILKSSLWQSLPVDCPPGSPFFVNAAVGFFPPPEQTPEHLLSALQKVERDFGRAPKTILNEPRTLDLDLIAFGRETRNTGTLVLPHPRAHQRDFVLTPLSEIAPDLILPGQSRSIAELLRELPHEGIARLT